MTAVFCLFLSFFFAAMGILQYQMIRGKKPVSTDAGIEAMNNDTVLVGGMPIGIYMETDGVMVLIQSRLPERMERSMNQQKELLKQAIILWQ